MINFKSNINTITFLFTGKLGLTSKFISFGAQIINRFFLEIYNMVLVGFSLQNSLKKVWFFEKTFLLANINMEIVLRMLFFYFSIANF